jgi:hypothetical protein
LVPGESGYRFSDKDLKRPLPDETPKEGLDLRRIQPESQTSEPAQSPLRWLFLSQAFTSHAVFTALTIRVRERSFDLDQTSRV